MTRCRVQIHVEDKEIWQVDNNRDQNDDADHQACDLATAEPRCTVRLLEARQINKPVEADACQDQIGSSCADAKERGLPLVVIGHPGGTIIEIATWQRCHRNQQAGNTVQTWQHSQVGECRRRHLGPHEDHSIYEVRAQSKGSQRGHCQSVDQQYGYVGLAALEHAHIVGQVGVLGVVAAVGGVEDNEHVCGTATDWATCSRTGWLIAAEACCPWLGILAATCLSNCLQIRSIRLSAANGRIMLICTQSMITLRSAWILYVLKLARSIGHRQLWLIDIF